jgi:hypothetical protein
MAALAKMGEAPLPEQETVMPKHENDQSVLNHITQLVEEERTLYSDDKIDDDERGRLEKLRVELDQCWDLLRQRRALREFGQDPDQATVRPAAVVEKYQQ